MIDLTGMNANQRAAVEWKGGALLVLAGPGSGKTRVLTYRIARLLEESPEDNFRILALTFTNKAASEMRGRVETLAPEFMERVRLTTFHSYAAEILQQYGSYVDVRPDFKILSDERDRLAVVKDAMNKLRKDLQIPLPYEFDERKVLGYITRMAEASIPIAESEGRLHGMNVPEYELVAKLYQEYHNILRSRNALDFPFLIFEVLALLRRYPKLSRIIRQTYVHLLVDEFQDTNQSQYEMLSMLAAPDSSTLFVVGDEDQIIYQWNGASPKRLSQLRNEFSVSELQLPENYRCPPLVVEKANRLISHNTGRTSKVPLRAVKSAIEGDVLRCFRFSTEEAEAGWIADDILSRGNEARGKCTVLGRTRRALDVVIKSLESRGIPVYSVIRQNEFQSAPLRLLHSFLRLLNDGEDHDGLAVFVKAFNELCSVNYEVKELEDSAANADCSVIDQWMRMISNDEMIDSSCQQLFIRDLRDAIYSRDYRLISQGITDWCRELEMYANPEDALNECFMTEMDIWFATLDDIEYQFKGERIGLSQMLREMDMRAKVPPKHPGSVSCYTIHASKGMEFEHVYLVGLEEDQLPSWMAVKKGNVSSEMQEERRNCFVAITRAQESLTLTCAKSVGGYWKSPSRFISEMGAVIEEIE